MSGGSLSLNGCGEGEEEVWGSVESLSQRTFCQLGFGVGPRRSEYFVAGQWGTESFTVEVTDGALVWMATADPLYVRRHMWPDGGRPGFMSVPQYLHRVRLALDAPTAGSRGFEYTLEPDKKDSRLLNLECRITIDEEENEKIVARLRLELCASSSEHKERLRQMLSWLMDREARSSALVLEHTRSAQANEEELKLLRAAVASLTTEKDQMELQLYEKFVYVLNAKKDKIRELQMHVDELKRSLVAQSGGVVKPQGKGVRFKQVEYSDMNELDSDEKDEERFDSDADDDNNDHDDDDDNDGLGVAQESLPLDHQILAGTISPSKGAHRKRVRSVAAVKQVVQEEVSSSMTTQSSSKRSRSAVSSASLVSSSQMGRRQQSASSRQMSRQMAPVPPPPPSPIGRGGRRKSGGGRGGGKMSSSSEVDAMDLIQDMG